MQTIQVHRHLLTKLEQKSRLAHEMQFDVTNPSAVNARDVCRTALCRITRRVRSALRHGPCRADENAQRFDFGITSFSAVCVAENRATFV